MFFPKYVCILIYIVFSTYIFTSLLLNLNLMKGYILVSDNIMSKFSK